MADTARTALELADEAIDFAPDIGIDIDRREAGATVLDFGAAEAGHEAGLLLAELHHGGAIAVDLRARTIDGRTWPVLDLSTDQPRVAVACVDWQSVPETDVAISGPGCRDTTDDFAVVVTEEREPSPGVVSAIARQVGVDPAQLYLAVAPPVTPAWFVDRASRVLDRTMAAIEEHEVVDGIGSVMARVALAPPFDTVDRATEAVDEMLRTQASAYVRLTTPVGTVSELAGEDVTISQVTVAGTDGAVVTAGSSDSALGIDQDRE